MATSSCPSLTGYHLLSLQTSAGLSCSLWLPSWGQRYSSGAAGIQAGSFGELVLAGSCQATILASLPVTSALVAAPTGRPPK